jgi:phenylpyruvate tautomerase PptA (4-oxalocrotonate tautomerase family)
MRPPVIKIPVPQNAKREEISKAINAKLTRKATDLVHKNREVVLSIFAFERTRRAGAKKARKS